VEEWLTSPIASGQSVLSGGMGIERHQKQHYFVHKNQLAIHQSAKSTPDYESRKNKIHRGGFSDQGPPKGSPGVFCHFWLLFGPSFWVLNSLRVTRCSNEDSVGPKKQFSEQSCRHRLATQKLKLTPIPRCTLLPCFKCLSEFSHSSSFLIL
jgi:hypothetical protein